MSHMIMNLIRFFLHLWPLRFGQDAIMARLSPPVPKMELVQDKLRDFPVILEYNPRTYLGRQIYYFGRYEPGIFKFYKNNIKYGMTFVDIGANYGLHSVVAAHQVGDGGRVIAFEPQAKLAMIVKNNIMLNKLFNTSVFQIGLSNESGSLELYYPSSTNDGQATLMVAGHEKVLHSETVFVRQLDDVLSENNVCAVDGIKIDVEGAELRVLEGGANLFRSNGKPVFVVFECIDEHLKRFNDSKESLFGFFMDHGYELWYHKRLSWHRMLRVDEYCAAGSPPDMLALASNCDIDPNI